MRTVSFPAENIEEFVTVTADQMQRIDDKMIQISKSTLLQMMERAGGAVAQIAGYYTSAYFPAVGILVGKGNNGGGAIVAARNLANKGANIQVILAETQSNLKPAVTEQLNILLRMYPDTPVHDMSQIDSDHLPIIPDCDLIIDGLLGYNIQGNPREPYATLIMIANNAKVPTLSVDIPSGLHPDSGDPYSPTILAVSTVTLAIPKHGFLNPEAQRYLGEVFLVDIGICPNIIGQVLDQEQFPKNLPRIMHLYYTNLDPQQKYVTTAFD